MTFKKLICAGLAGLGALAIAALLIDPSLAQTAAPAAAPAAPAAPAHRRQQGRQRLDADLDRSRSVMTIPGLGLFYGGMVRKKNMLSVLTHVFYTVCVVTLIWVIYGYSLAFTGGVHRHRRLRQVFLQGRHRRLARRRPSRSASTIPEYVYICFQMTFATITPGADRRRLRRAHEVLGGGAVHPALGDPRLLPDRAHGLVLGRPGRDRRGRQGTCRGDHA